MKNPWIIIGVITVLLFGGAIWYSGISEENSNEGVEITGHTKGNAEAAVVLVEYSDFECPACASFQPVLKEIMIEYGDKLRLEYKHFPLPIPGHENALPAAVAAEAAGQQGKFFEFHDKLFENQSAWGASVSPSLQFVKYAEELGLDIPTFKRQMDSSVLRDKVRAEMLEGRTLGISGTPTFFLNGKKMEYSTFQEFIEQIAVTVDPSSVSSSTVARPDPAIKFGI